MLLCLVKIPTDLLFLYVKDIQVACSTSLSENYCFNSPCKQNEIWDSLLLFCLVPI